MSSAAPISRASRPDFWAATFATVSGVLGVFALLAIPGGSPITSAFAGVAAAVLGHLARRQIRRGRRDIRNFTIATAGLVLGSISAALAGLQSNPEPRARIMSCRRIATSLETAIHNYHTEFGRLPGTSEIVITDGPEGAELLRFLCGENTGPENPGRIRFLSVREATKQKNGLVFDAEGRPIALLDSWGRPFTVFLDADDDEQLHIRIGSQPHHLSGLRAAVMSPGPDGKPGTKDDVRTW